MSDTMTFQRATKSRATLRAALFGPSGAGKTFTALRIATGLGGPVAVIDTERGSASKYADRFRFDVLELDHAAIPDYRSAIAAAARAGYPILVIDSLSHGWQELLQEVDRLANTKYRGNTWAAWAEGTSKQRALVDAILAYPGHVIATMRSKTEWIVESDAKGKSRPIRVGLAPEQGKGIEYEFDLLLELSPDHVGRVIKDRTGRDQDRLIDRPDESFGQELAAWLSLDAPPPPQADPHLTAPVTGETPLPEIDEPFREKVKKLIERAASAGAWTQAEDYLRERFTGEQLGFALAELEKAAAASVQAQAA